MRPPKRRNRGDAALTEVDAEVEIARFDAVFLELIREAGRRLIRHPPRERGVRTDAAIDHDSRNGAAMRSHAKAERRARREHERIGNVRADFPAGCEELR